MQENELKNIFLVKILYAPMVVKDESSHIKRTFSSSRRRDFSGLRDNGIMTLH